jgi:hypothetical protein
MLLSTLNDDDENTYDEFDDSAFAEGRLYFHQDDHLSSSSSTSSTTTTTTQTTVEDEDGMGFVTATKTSSDIPKTSSDVPIVDNGATDHLWDNASDLQNTIPCYKRFRTGNKNSPITATIKGEVTLTPKLPGFTPIVLPNVYHSPQIGVKLISEKAILKQFPGSARGGDYENYKIHQRNFNILTAKGPGNSLFTLNSHKVSQNKTSSSSYALFNLRDSRFVHNLMGHTPIRTINNMARYGAIKGLEPIPSEHKQNCDCESCIAGKLTKRRRNNNNEPIRNLYCNNTIRKADSWKSDQKGPITPRENQVSQS